LKYIQAGNVFQKNHKFHSSTKLYHGNHKELQNHRTKYWTYQEDMRLIVEILQWGEKDWSKIGTFGGSQRSRTQRWTRSINPKIKIECCSSDED
jgi:hypothetical protein